MYLSGEYPSIPFCGIGLITYKQIKTILGLQKQKGGMSFLDLKESIVEIFLGK